MAVCRFDVKHIAEDGQRLPHNSLPDTFLSYYAMVV
jgi:hypothetical protein